jgi:hypothetical protein
VIVIRLAVQPTLPHGVDQVDISGSSNGVVDKMGAASGP